MKTLKFVVPALVLAAGMVVTTTTSNATPAIAKKENVKSCTTCHVKIHGSNSSPIFLR